MTYFNLERVCMVLADTARHHANVASAFKFDVQSNAAEMTRLSVVANNNIMPPIALASAYSIAEQFRTNRNEAVYNHLQLVPKLPSVEVEKIRPMSRFQKVMKSILHPAREFFYASNANSISEAQVSEPAKVVAMETKPGKVSYMSDYQNLRKKPAA